MPKPVFSGTLTATNLAEALRMLVQAKKTGNLVLDHDGVKGAVALENGLIINAKAEDCIGMHALFQFVSWNNAHFEFQEQPLAPDLTRDLSVYDPEVLITGVAAKTGACAEI
jgi:hypothetical protein